MTYQEARDTAVRMMLGAYAGWADDEVKALEATGLTSDEAARTFNAQLPAEEASAVLNCKSAN